MSLLSATPGAEPRSSYVVRHRKIILFVSLVLCLVGVYAAFRMPAAVFPQTDFPRVVLLIDNGVMPADEMMATVTRPIEEAMKGTPGTITIRSMSDDRLRAVRQVVEEKLVRRKVSLKALDWGKIEPASGGSVRQVATLVAGINSDKARDVNKFIKGLGLKGVQTQTQGEQVRVMAKKRDQLQAVITELKGHDFGIPIDTGNFRD